MFSSSTQIIMIFKLNIKIEVGNYQEKAPSEKIPTPNTEVGKTKLTIRYLYLQSSGK